MAEQTPQTAVPQTPEDDFDAKFKARLKDVYGIEEDAETFKTKRAQWKKAEEELPQYQQTLNQVIQYVKENEDRFVQKPVTQEVGDDDERLRQLGKVDPYEATKRYVSKVEKTIDEKLQQYSQQSVQQSEAAMARREGLRRAHEQVTQQWPEAFDENSPLHQEGKKIFRQEMSQMEQQHPLAFLIATERAAGRLGIAPKGRRGNSNRREQVSAQSVSRDGVRADRENDDDKPLTERQKQIAEGLGVDPKVYKQAMKNRKAQAAKKAEEKD